MQMFVSTYKQQNSTILSKGNYISLSVRTRCRQRILIQNTEQPIRIKIGLTASRSIFKNKIKQKSRAPAISPGRAANSSGKNRISNAVWILIDVQSSRIPFRLHIANIFDFTSCFVRVFSSRPTDTRGVHQLRAIKVTPHVRKPRPP